VSVISGDVRGPIVAVAAACSEAILLEGSSVGPLSAEDARRIGLESPEAIHRILDDLARDSGRPLPLLAAATHHDVLVKEYVQQELGQKSLFTDWQIQQQADRDLWLEKRVVAGDGKLDNSLLVRYRLFDGIQKDMPSAMASLGIKEKPPMLRLSWVDSAIQLLVMQSWLPRVLLMVAFFSLLAELGNPGIGVGGFLSALCFAGFFWIEGLNGNVESLEIILFVFGIIALLLEVFVIPGFGVFGIGGLLMLLVSVVLASQTFVWPSNSAQLSEVAVNLFWVACLALGGMIGLLFMHKQLERSPLLKWVTLNPAGPEELNSLDMRETTAHREHLYGQEGLTTTRLNPSGKAQFGSDIVSVVGTGKLIGKGVPVQVVEVRGPLVIVEELDLSQ
jgi:membrane-bound ClpP family serine protease